MVLRRPTGMMTRRSLLTAAGLAPLGLFGLGALAGCGSSGSDDVVQVEAPRAAPDDAAIGVTVAGVSAFTADLYRALAGGASDLDPSANLVCSPYSVATALGMVALGARGTTASELLTTLHATGDAARFAAGLGGIDLALARREVDYPRPDGSTERVALRAANSVWGHKDVTWQRPFLEGLAREFGAGMRVVDYTADTEGARRKINTWVSGKTAERIPELVPGGVLDPLTRLVLVNALYFKAGWQTPFEPDSAAPRPFTRLDGSTAQAPMMSTSMNAGWAQGTDWVAADLPYADGGLAMLVVLPAAGRFAAVEKALDGAFLTAALATTQPTQVAVTLPRWRVRTQVSLRETLEGLGIRTAFSDAADFSGMTTDERLQISAVIHEGWIAVDEAGTEAAAATAVAMRMTSAPAEPPRALVADRPFLYVIHDVATRTPLFVGRVTDPTVTD